MTETISVIIPTWNRAETIKRAIKSVLQQTYPVSEILVCDDGSIDNSKNVVKKISEKDKRVKWVPGKHSGLPAVPRNRGIKRTQGDWIAFLDSDDYWHAEKIKSQVSLLKKEGATAICTNGFGFSKEKIEAKPMINFSKKEVNFNDLLSNNAIITSSVLIEKNLLFKYGLFPETEKLKGTEDYSLWLRIANFTTFRFINKPLVYYRDEPQESIRKNLPPYLFQRYHSLINFLLWSFNNKYFNPKQIKASLSLLKIIAKSAYRLIK